MKRLALVAGARPNFMKIAPVLHAIDKLKPTFETSLVHTGQHYSPDLSDVFFEQLEIRRPDAHLEAGSGTHGQQTARVLELFEKYLLDASPKVDCVMVVGDVNSTLAAALAAAKLEIDVVHLEAGLRSGDRGMPEEINRLATDAISDLLLVSEPAGEANLLREGVPASRIRYVGNVMIDSVARHLPAGERVTTNTALVTLHRPSNVDSEQSLRAIVAFVLSIAGRVDVTFPIHPRTRESLSRFGLMKQLSDAGITLLPPQGYKENLKLMSEARVVITDSGGIQEETSFLRVPCLTLRENTERPVTVELGTNTVVGSNFDFANRLIEQILSGQYKQGRPIPGWDGRAAERVVHALSEFLA